MADSVYRAGENPALSLYRLWHMMVEASNSKWDTLARQTHGYDANGTWTNPARLDGVQPQRVGERTAISVWNWDSDEHPIFCLGWSHPRQPHTSGSLLLDAQGRFQIRDIGWGLRARFEVNSFLVQDVIAGKRVWAVSTRHTPHWPSASSIGNEAPYVECHAMRTRRWNQPIDDHWCALEPYGDHWRIVPADPGGEAIAEQMQESHQRYLRRTTRALKRYHAMRGEPDPTKPLSIRSNGAKLEGDQAIACIAMALDVYTPARSVPRRRALRPAEEATT